MHYQSTLVVSRKSDLEPESITTLLSEDAVGLENLFSIAPEKNRATIGINQAKELVEWAYRKSSELKIGSVLDAHTMTREAQNSLLKIIEEPPMHTQIVLISRDLESIIETIISRCRIIFHEVETEEDISEDILSELKERSFVEREKIIANIFANESREVFSRVVEKLISDLTEQIDQENYSKLNSMIESLLEIIRSNKQNVNQKILTDGLNIVLEEKSSGQS